MEDNLVEKPENNVEESKNEKIQEKTFRDTIYGRIDVSKETMDKVIIVLFILLIASIVAGVIVQ